MLEKTPSISPIAIRGLGDKFNDLPAVIYAEVAIGSSALGGIG
jgi:hypothetical protein